MSMVLILILIIAETSVHKKANDLFVVHYIVIV